MRGIVASLFLSSACASTGRPQPEPVMRRTLDGLQRYLVESGWKPVDVPRDVMAAGAVVVAANANGWPATYVYVSRLSDCADSSVPIAKGPAGLPTVEL